MNVRPLDRSEALRVLRAGPPGVRLWNRLRGAGARPPSLACSDLSDAFLEGADLRDVDLGGADLGRAALPRARLSGACLVGASLVAADLFLADLAGADLSRADLEEAQLTRTRLHGAELRGAVFGETLVDCDLTGARHLDRVVHRAPSDLSFAALRDYRGRMPSRFLEGCAVARVLLRMARLERANGSG